MQIRARQLDVGDKWRVYSSYTVTVASVEFLPSDTDPVWVNVSVKNADEKMSHLFIKPSKKVWIEE